VDGAATLSASIWAALEGSVAFDMTTKELVVASKTAFAGDLMVLP